MELMRLLSGITRLAENRDVELVELKVGQVVRGVLLKMLSEQEGLVNIGGVPVRARLETPLQPGEATLLQVQPQSGGAVIVLKPLTGSETPIADRSMADLLYWLGMKNNEGNRQLLQMMHQAGLPIDRETTRAMQRIADLRPEGVDAGRWLTAATLARSHQLPLTRETVLALHTVLSGQTPGDALQGLREALSAWLRAGTGNSPAANPSTIQTAERLLALLDRLVHETAERLARPQPTAVRANPGSVQSTGTVPGGPSSPGSTPSMQTGMNHNVETGAVRSDGPLPQSGREAEGAVGRTDGSARPARTAPSTEQHQSVPLRTTAQASRPAETVIPRDGSAGSDQVGAKLEGRGAEMASRAANAQGAANPTVASGHEAETHAQTARATVVAESAAQGGATGPRPEPWLVTLFRELGFEHEHRVFERLMQPGEGAEAVRETAKGLIMTLQADSQLPPALREALQQTLQAITGQQLLMAADRQAPISVVTMTVPLFTSEEGEQQSATVQIHARKPQGEALDAANCRLLFDLNLAKLGTLLMDVQVVDRMVSVRVHSDHPVAGLLMADGKKEAEDALAQIGYRLVTLQHLPYPGQDSGDERVGTGGGSPAAANNLVSAFNPKPYKGVDVRI